MRVLALAASLCLGLALLWHPAFGDQSQGGRVTSAPQLQLPSGSFPASFRITRSTAIDGASADQLFMQSSIHAISYVDLGMTGGWYTEASQTLADGGFTLSFLGSYYTDSQAAQYAFLDATHSIDVTISPCSFGEACAEIPLDLTDDNGNDLLGTMRVVQVANSLFEAGFLLPDADLPSKETSGRAYLDSLTNAYLAALRSLVPPTPAATATSGPTMSPTPRPSPTATPIPATDFSMWVRVERSGEQPDWDQVTPPLRQIVEGSSVQLSIYAVIRSAPGASPVTDSFTVRSGRQVVLHQSSPDTLGTPASGTYWRHAEIRLDRPGQYTFQGSVKVNGQVRSAQTKLTVLRRELRRQPPVSFTFDQLQARDDSGQPRQSFRVGEPVTLVTTYTVRHLRGTANVSFIRSYQYRSGAVWKPNAHPVEDRFDVSQGHHFRSVRFIPNSGYRLQRILIGITIGAMTKSRAVTLFVR